MKARIKLCTNEPNKKIPCIKFYRWLTNKGLKDSKDFIEDLQEKFGNKPAEFVLDTTYNRETIEEKMDECKLGGSAFVGDGVEGSFFGIGKGIIRLKMSFNNNTMEMDLPMSNLGAMVDSFLINAVAAKEFAGEPDPDIEEINE